LWLRKRFICLAIATRNLAIAKRSRIRIIQEAGTQLQCQPQRSLCVSDKRQSEDRDSKTLHPDNVDSFFFNTGDEDEDVGLMTMLLMLMNLTTAALRLSRSPILTQGSSIKLILHGGPKTPTVLKGCSSCICRSIMIYRMVPFSTTLKDS